MKNIDHRKIGLSSGTKVFMNGLRIWEGCKYAWVIQGTEFA